MNFSLVNSYFRDLELVEISLRREAFVRIVRSASGRRLLVYYSRRRLRHERIVAFDRRHLTGIRNLRLSRISFLSRKLVLAYRRKVSLIILDLYNYRAYLFSPRYFR